MTARQEYDLMKEDLLIWYPELTGQWVKDRKVFTEIWKENQKAIKKTSK